MMHSRTIALLGSLFLFAGCGGDRTPSPAAGAVPAVERGEKAPAGVSTGPRAYVSSFGSGKLSAIDLASGRLVGSLDVEDGAGSVACAASKDGRTLFVVDGAQPGRLRVLDARTLGPRATYSVANRELQLGLPPRIFLSDDERTLSVGTFDYKTLKSGAVAVDLATGTTTLTSEHRNGTMTVDAASGISAMLGEMDDPAEAGSRVWLQKPTDGGPSAFVHGTHAWFVGKGKRVVGSARLPGFGHDARFTPDNATLVTYVWARHSLVAVDRVTGKTRELRLSTPCNGPVDFVVSSAP